MLASFRLTLSWNEYNWGARSIKSYWEIITHKGLQPHNPCSRCAVAGAQINQWSFEEIYQGGPAGRAKTQFSSQGGNLNIHKNMGSIDVNRVWSCLIQIASARTQPEPPWLQLNCECCFTPAPSEGADINVTPIKAIGNVHWILQMLSDLRWAVWMVNIT
jgi:hypothetical protein